MDVKRKDTVKELIIEVVDEFSAQEESGFFYEWRRNQLDRFRFVNIFDRFDKDSRILVSHLTEEVELKYRQFDSLSAIGPADYEYIGVWRRYHQVPDALLYEAQIYSSQIGHFGLEFHWDRFFDF